MTVYKNSLAMIRGDSETIIISVNDYTLKPGDVIEMTVRKSSYDKDVTLYKKVTSFNLGEAIIDILPSDTRNLNSGIYVYDVQLTQEGGIVTTIIPPSEFKIIGDITHD